MNVKVINRILSLLIIVGVIYVVFFHKPEPEHILDPNIQWKTDTIKIPSEYVPPQDDELKDTVKPRYIYIYQTDTSALDSLKLIIKNKNIIISGLEDSISINQNYLKQYPNNPKLIALGLVYDTLSLSLLSISGIITETDYPIFIDYHKYIWFKGTLSKEDHIRPVPSHKNYLNYKAGFGYDFLYLTPYIQGESNYNWKNFEIYGRVGIGLLNIKSSEIKVGVNYNLGKHGKN